MASDSPAAVATAAACRALLVSAEPPGLGPGPRTGVLDEAGAREAARQFLATHPLPRDAASLVTATTLLWHDLHDPAHELCQAVETRDGSWVHGLLHRREPDYGNAAYWYRRVGQHPAFTALAAAAGTLTIPGTGPLRDQVIPGGRWDPLAFIDACAAAERQPDRPDGRWLRAAQACEFQVLLEHLAGRPGPTATSR